MQGNGTHERNGRRPRNSVGLPPAALDRLPPHDIESEQGLLGCVMLEPRQALPELRLRMKDPEDLFYDLRHAAIAAKMCEVADSGRTLDLITLQEALKRSNQLEAVGGVAYLTALPDVTPSWANIPHYLAIVEEKAQLRKLIRVCSETIDRAYSSDGANAEQVLGLAERDVLGVRATAAKDADGMKELVAQAISDIEELHQRQGAIGGITTGIIDLDKVHDGLHVDELIVLAAYPSTGKTALAMNIATAVAGTGHAVGVVSQEMRARKLVGRMMAARARVNLRSIRDGFLAERDFPKLAGAAQTLAKLPIHFCDIPGLSVYQVRAKARLWKLQHDVKLVVIDYLQLLNADGGPRHVESRQLEISTISRQLKQMAGELGITVLALSQLNDDGQVRESRAPEQDADSLWKLRLVNDAQDEQQDRAAVGVDLDINKQRNGPSPYTVHLTFFKGYTLFENAARVSD